MQISVTTNAILICNTGLRNTSTDENIFALDIHYTKNELHWFTITQNLNS